MEVSKVQLLDKLRTSILSDVAEVWEEEPVDVITFLREFQHKEPFPEQEKLLIAWFGLEPKLFDTKYKELDAVWGMGSGKDFICSAGTSYLAYKLICLKSPQRYFNMGLSESIDLVNVSFNAEQAKYVYFKKLQDCIKDTINPKTGNNWFEEHGMTLGDGSSKKDVQSKVINFPKNVRAFSLNSKSSAPEGTNILVSIFDEVGRFEFSQAKSLYDVLAKNTTSRYGDKGKTVLISYPEADDDFLMYRYENGLNDPEVYSSRKATWEVNLKRTKEDFRRYYTSDGIVDAMKKYECIPPKTRTGFITFPEKIEECADRFLESPVEYEYSTTVRTIKDVEKSFVAVNITKMVGDDKVRFLHGDPALVHDSYVLAMGYCDEVEGETADGYTAIVSKPVIDVIIKWTPERDKPIDIINVKEVIEMLCEKFTGIQKVTFDKWNSADIIQSLQDKGIVAEDMSFSNTEQMAMYSEFRNLLHSNRVAYLDNETLKKELKHLQLINNNKVDHPRAEGHSKDVADAVVAVVYWLMSETESVLNEVYY